VTVELLTDEPDAIFAPGRRVFAGTVDGDLARDPADRRNPESKQALVVEEVKPFKDGLIVKFDLLADRTAAEPWRQRYLLVPAEELTPPGENEVFVHELVGMRVVDTEGAPIGDVIGFYELPQGLALEVRTPDKGDLLLPYRSEAIVEVDRTTRVITANATTGLFD